MTLPTDAKARKAIPIYTGFVKYFPKAIAAVAQLSQVANEQHNPGQPVHWAKEKSTDEPDALMRHLTDQAQGEVYDTDGILHAIKVAWRAMANLERLLESGVGPLKPRGWVNFCDQEPLRKPHRAKCHVTCGSLKCEREGCSGDTHLPPICSDCGVDLREGLHAAACLTQDANRFR